MSSLQGRGFFPSITNTSLTVLSIAGSGETNLVQTDDGVNALVVCIGTGDQTVIFGNSAYNSVYGSLGNLFAVGGTGGSSMHGGAGSDILIGLGEWGGDFLSGGDGNDIIALSRGYAVGGSGADQFYILPGSGWDGRVQEVQIGDFKPGIDTLNLSWLKGADPNHMHVVDNTLQIFTQSGEVDVGGVGQAITDIGGVEAAVLVGVITPDYSFYSFDGARG